MNTDACSIAEALGVQIGTWNPTDDEVEIQFKSWLEAYEAKVLKAGNPNVVSEPTLRIYFHKGIDKGKQRRLSIMNKHDCPLLFDAPPIPISEPRRISEIDLLREERDKWSVEAQLTRQKNDKLQKEITSLEASRDYYRNSLYERAEEVQGLRASNANLATRIGELIECQKDSRRLDFLQGRCVMNPPLSIRLPDGYDIRKFIDDQMEEAEERRQDRISELQAELAKLCRESGGEG